VSHDRRLVDKEKQMESPATERATNNARARETQQARLRVSLEAAGEIILMILVGGFFVYLFVESLQWPLGSALMPWITVGIGAPFWLYRLLVLIVRAREAPAQIMDIGFRVGDDPSGEKARFFRICSFIIGLYLAIWLFGFHVALPLGMLFYLRVYGEVSWWWALIVALMFLALIVGVYDRLLGAVWHEPLAVEWFYSIF
jgi:hypothetical protein